MNLNPCSGTTGIPKGVMLTNKNLCANFDSIATLKELTTNHNFLAILPLHHALPLMATLLVPLFSNNKATFMQDLKQSALLECIKEAKITAIIGIPELYNMLYKSITSKLKSLPSYKKLFAYSLLSIFP